MGSDAFEVTGAPLSPNDIKVHRLMCTELMNLLDGVSRILQKIEAAQPRGSNAMSSLCMLNNANSKSKKLIQHCSESSKLYLALTGDTIATRCQKTKNQVEQSLGQLQNMVPVVLAAEISRTIYYSREIILRLDPAEQDAGKVLRDLLLMYSSSKNSSDQTAKAFQVALLRLHISSQKDIVIEKRSIKKQLGKVAEKDPVKKKILSLLLRLLDKYGKLVLKEHGANDPTQHEEPFQFSNSGGLSDGKDSHLTGITRESHNKWQTPVIPEEYKCPFSKRLMYDPVVIASGVTFERFWIQKWFDEGHNVCPKTTQNLDHFSLTPNLVMKDLITDWCAKTGVTLADPGALAVESPFENSSSSISSLSNSMRNLAFPIDMSNLSMSSSQISDSCEAQSEDMNFSSTSNVDYQSVQYRRNTHASDMESLVGLDALSWESKCTAIEDTLSFLKHGDHTCSMMSCGSSIQPLLTFMKEAENICDVKAMRTGCLLLSAFVEKCRNSIIRCLEEGAYKILASFLDSEVARETLSLLEALSSLSPCNKEIAASGALHHFLRILDEDSSDLKEPVLKILRNLSAKTECKSLIAPCDFIPRLISQFGDSALERFCLMTIKNLCDDECTRVFVAESENCVSSIVKLLESESQDDQENAVAVLLSLCSQRLEYCQLVMAEGIIPPLSFVSINGNNKGRSMALELLRILKDEVRDNSDSSVPQVVVCQDPTPSSKEKKSSRGIFFTKFTKFTKR